MTENLAWINFGLITAFIAILFRYRKNRIAAYSICLLVCVLCYIGLVLDRQIGVNHIVRIVFSLGLMWLAFFFWIASLAYFSDSFRFSRFHLMIWILKTATPFLSSLALDGRLGSLSYRNVLGPKTIDEIIGIFPSVLFSLALVFHALIEAYRGSQDDLIESRIRIRKFFVFVFGSMIIWIALTYILLPTTGLSEWIDLGNQLLMFASLIVFFVLSLRFVPGIFEITYISDQKQSIPEQIYPEEKGKLLEAFEKSDLFYRESLTIRKVSQELKIPEYILRRIINGDLGFRNFNDFLNRYRIQKACELLDNTELPVIRIALDLGYGSPAPFNRAFRQITGFTPTEYRKSKFEDS